MDTQLSAFERMELSDEQQVLNELKGLAVDELVYQFQQGKQVVTGLSLAGVRETANEMNRRRMARLSVSDKEPIVIETEDYFEVRIYARDELNGAGYWGIKRQSKFYGNGSSPNPFAYEQALSKAQRNALRGLIPEWFVKQIIASWIQKRGRTIPGRHYGEMPPEVGEIDSGDESPVEGLGYEIKTRRLTESEIKDAVRVPGSGSAPLPPTPSIPSHQNGVSLPAAPKVIQTAILDYAEKNEWPHLPGDYPTLLKVAVNAGFTYSRITMDNILEFKTLLSKGMEAKQ